MYIKRERERDTHTYATYEAGALEIPVIPGGH